jgi:hypothetical protein
MKPLSFNNHLICVNRDVEITNGKTFMPAATSGAIHAEVSTCKY